MRTMLGEGDDPASDLREERCVRRATLEASDARGEFKASDI